MKRGIVQHLPKIELHCHLDGSIQPHTLKKLAALQEIPFPDDEESLRRLLTVSENCTSLLEYLTKFDPVLPLLQTKEALEIAAFDLIEQVAQENVLYIEVRFAPTLSTRKGLSHIEVVEAVLKGLKKGEEAFGVKSNALLCGMRHHTAAQNIPVVQTANHFFKKGVVGVDLAGDELHYPPELFTEMLSLAKDYAIPLTLHAGECGCAQNVRTSIELGAKRIGHGIALENDPELIQECVAQKILIEMCPTSNLQTKTVASKEAYPFMKFLAAGLHLCINTDNRTVSGTTLTDEYLQLANWYALSFETFEATNHYAIDGAFITEAEKEKLHEKIRVAYQALV